MEQNPSERHKVAFGGKEFDLELRDVNTPDKTIFKAKNVS